MKRTSKAVTKSKLLLSGVAVGTVLVHQHRESPKHSWRDIPNHAGRPDTDNGRCKVIELHPKTIRVRFVHGEEVLRSRADGLHLEYSGPYCCKALYRVAPLEMSTRHRY